MGRRSSHRLRNSAMSSVVLIIGSLLVRATPALAATTCTYDSSSGGTVTVTGGPWDTVVLSRSAGSVSVAVNDAYVPLPSPISCTGGSTANTAASVTVNTAGGGDPTSVVVYVAGWTGASITIADPDATSDGDHLYLLGSDGNETIDAGNLGFTITAARVSCLDVEAGAGNDTLTAGQPAGMNLSSGTNTEKCLKVQGEGGDDTITGSSVGELLDGGSGNDTISGGGGGDLLIGGGGIATDELNGEGGADTLYGSAGNDVLRGGEGSDILRAQNGDDQLFGGAGDDLLFGSTGADSFDGGDGEDTISYTDASGSVTINMTRWVLRGAYAVGDDLAGAVDWEILQGSLYADALTGSGGADTIVGAGGNDRISGGDGDDDLSGDGGTGDSINGGLGNDTCSAERERNCEQDP